MRGVRVHVEVRIDRVCTNIVSVVDRTTVRFLFSQPLAVYQLSVERVIEVAGKCKTATGD